ncbi:MAG TPA: hypothetical protein VFE08_05470 [Candidatus Sulfotelmatobacter sp.]|jgi:CTP:molybdopterin cytidylyltransferase MocA|nr:hypothetical protein [Candidatus Sulfotelmatobacter sp.]
MRTTLNLDDDVVGRLREYAEQRSMAIGKAASDLVRRGLNAQVQTRLVNGLHVVVLPADSPKISTEHVRRLLEDEI